jgi:ADP-heptose:LPS heptosyltransferase
MKTIVLAPFSNNSLRDWPAAHYSAFAGLLLDRLEADDRLCVIGTRGQRAAAAAVVRGHPADRVVNLAGHLVWDDAADLVRSAACVIGNNSGVAHLSTLMGIPTVCVFGGSHQRTEWAPLGASAIIVSRQIGCSPCQLHLVRECRYGVACLRDIVPQTVVDAAFTIMARVDAARDNARLLGAAA